MAEHTLPDRRIDIPIHSALQHLDEPREIDTQILVELQARPVTTGYVSEQIDEQPGYVSQRLSTLTRAGVLEQLGHGFYEVNPRVVSDHER